MRIDDKAPPANEPSVDPRSVPTRKKVYRKPEVSDFGNVRDITRGGGSAGTEGGMTGLMRSGG